MIENTASFINNQYSDGNTASIMQGTQFRNDKNRDAVDGLSTIIAQFDKYINSVNETLGSVESLEGMEETQESTTNKINVAPLMDQYNSLLAQFTAEQKVFYQNTLANMQPENASKYLESRHRTVDDKLIYVNKFGYTHVYNGEPSADTNLNCPPISSDPITETEMNALKGSYNFQPNMTCNLAGTVIRKSSGDLAWIDIKGQKHTFIDTTLKDSSGCDAKPVSVDDVTWDMIPTAGAMESADTCTTMQMDNAAWQSLTEKNKQLLDLSKEIMNTLNTASNATPSSNIEQQKQTMQQHQSLLNQASSNVQYILSNQHNIDGKEHVSKIAMKSSLNHYIVWLLVAITIFLITTHSIYSNSANLAYVVVLVILIALLYRYGGYIYERL